MVDRWPFCVYTVRYGSANYRPRQPTAVPPVSLNELLLICPRIYTDYGMETIKRQTKGMLMAVSPQVKSTSVGLDCGVGYPSALSVTHIAAAVAL